MGTTAGAFARRWWRTHPEVRFPVRFVAAALLAVAVNTAIDPAQPTLQRTTSSVVLWLSGLFDLGAQQHPEWLLSFGRGEFGYIVSPACVGTIIGLIYTAGVVAYPATWSQRGIGIAAGIPLLFAINVTRLVSLGWIGVQSREAFDVVHVYGWGLFNVSIVAATWLAWIHYIAHRHDTTSTQPNTQTKTKQNSKSWRLRPSILRLTLGVSVFAGLLLLGVQAHADHHYGQVVLTVASSMASLVTGTYWELRLAEPTSLTSPFAFQYGFLAAGIALFLATPSKRLRTSVIGTIFIAVPTIVLVHGGEASLRIIAATRETAGVVTFDQTAALGSAALSASDLSTALQAVLPIVLWLTWKSRSKRANHHPNSARRKPT